MAVTYTTQASITLGNRAAFYRGIATFFNRIAALSDQQDAQLLVSSLTLNPDRTFAVVMNNPFPGGPEQLQKMGLVAT